jgi:hypothetical protein
MTEQTSEQVLADPPTEDKADLSRLEGERERDFPKEGDK